MTHPRPYCGADRCPETRPVCRAWAEHRRALYDAAQGFVRAFEPTLETMGTIARRLAREMTRPRTKGGAR